MNVLQVESARVTQLSSGVTAAGDGLTAEITAMNTTLDEVRAGWQSTSAAPKFVQVMQDHLDQVTVLKDALLGHGTALSTAAVSYDEAEAAVAGTAQGV